MTEYYDDLYYVSLVGEEIHQHGLRHLGFLCQGDKVIERVYISSHFAIPSEGVAIVIDGKRYLMVLFKVKRFAKDIDKPLKLHFGHGLVYDVRYIYAGEVCDGTKFLEGREIEQDLRCCGITL